MDDDYDLFDDDFDMTWNALDPSQASGSQSSAWVPPPGGPILVSQILPITGTASWSKAGQPSQGTYRSASDGTCPICKASLPVHTTDLLLCGAFPGEHRFHSGCLLRRTMSDSTCTVCKKDLADFGIISGKRGTPPSRILHGLPPSTTNRKGGRLSSKTPAQTMMLVHPTMRTLRLSRVP